nr:alkaline phosphatase family protein [Ktedonobacterales bacterium]
VPASPTPQTNAPTTAAGTLAYLAQAALAKGSSISYEGIGGGTLLSALPNPADHAFILDDQTTFPTSLAAQLGAQGITPPGELAAPDAAHAPDVARISAFTQAYLRVILPQLKATSTPFLSIIREPEPVTSATLGGIGSVSFTAALRANDDALGQLISGLSDAGLADKVNLVVTSDHGIADVVPPDQTSASQVTYPAPNNALRTDLGNILAGLAQAGPLGALPDVGKSGVARGASASTKQTTVVVTPQGGNDALTLAPSDLVLKAGQGDATRGKKVVTQELVRALQGLPQVGPIFVNDALDVPEGALPLTQLGPLGPQSPDVLVGFVTFAHDIGQRGVNTVQLAGSEYADTAGIAAWGAFGRRDIHCILYLSGPNFKGGDNYSDLAPTGFTDLAPTIETIMNFDAPAGQSGRVIAEALTTDATTTAPAAPTLTSLAAKATASSGASYIQVVTFEHFAGYSYLHGAYALRAQGAQNLDDLVTQATALANGE